MHAIVRALEQPAQLALCLGYRTAKRFAAPLSIGSPA
jgi:hypothetical protein